MQKLLNKTAKSNDNNFKQIVNAENNQKNKEQKENTNDSEKKRKIRKSIKYYSINIRKTIKKKMDKIYNKNRYKRNIYKLLYDQIRSDITDINKEIKKGKQLVVPYAVLKNRMLLERKKCMAIFRVEDSSNNNNTNKKTEGKNIIIPKIKNINLINNSCISNTTICTTLRNDLKPNTLDNIIKFKKKNNYTLNLKTRNKQQLDLIKTVTENNNNTMKDGLILTNNNDNEKNRQSIFQTDNDDNYIDKIYPNTERNNYVSNNNIIQTLNNKSMDKTFIKTSIYRDNLETFIKQRKKCLYVTYDEKWYSKNKFINIKLDKLVIGNNFIQSRIIHDQYALINEGIKLFQSKYLVDKELLNKFNSTNIQNQQIINVNIEESIGLMIEISYLLLEKYEDNLLNFITQVVKRPNQDEYKLIEDEKKEFSNNIALFAEACSFLSVSYKSYLILIQKDEHYNINKKNFNKIQQFLDRLRLCINKLILDMKILFYGNNNREKKIITECVHKIIKIKEQKYGYEKKQKLDCHRKFGDFRTGIDPFKYKGQIKIKSNDDKEIKMRINKALGRKNYNENNFNNIKKFDINSKLVSDLMKYGTKEFREFVIYERIRRKFYDK